jgi:hypothetical protein
MSLKDNDIGRVLEISHAALCDDSVMGHALELGAGMVVPGVRQMFTWT